ncbi:CPBP family intramembrane glutamic endopeptidase [Marisediminicola sp. LYQ85]|uniref:CPBP family intramembrane glutamic endopeptidase n=1 Tax=Marisediminicola sp. LYQ85 TaxID=3391062 RepID=UPI0039836293
MPELILYSIPAVIYFLVQGSRKRLGRRQAAERLGATWGGGRDYLWAAVLLIPLGVLGYLAIILIPDSALDAPGVTITAVTSVGAAVAVIARALGEEILFRGLIGGVLFRRLGFIRGNILQAIIFMVPHLLLLAVDPAMWPILPVQFVAALLLGWLRHRSGSVLPGALAHAVANIGAGLLAG